MEEWHQKLHNNTTPDDVPICQAYLAFLQVSGGALASSLSPCSLHTLQAGCSGDMPEHLLCFCHFE